LPAITAAEPSEEADYDAWNGTRIPHACVTLPG